MKALGKIGEKLSSSSLHPCKKNHKNKGITKLRLSSLPLFLTFLSQSFSILFVAVHLFFLRGSFVSSVGATLPTQTLFKVANARIYWVSTVPYCLARRRNRSGCGFVTFFVWHLQNSLHFIFASSVRKLARAATFRLVNFLQHTNRTLHSTGKPHEV